MPFAHHILFPVDFSERCLAVRPSVISMARHFQAKLTLMHVIQIPAGCYGGGEPVSPILSDIPGWKEQIRRRLDEFWGSPRHTGDVETIVEHGDPAACITQYAEQHGIGLIMIPTHGYGKFRSLLVGSVTAKVLHDATCPVWTSAHTEDPALAAGADPRSILCAVGLGPENADLISYAFALACSFKAQLRLVHAVSIAEAYPERDADAEYRESVFHLSREEIRKLQRAGTDLDVHLELGKAPSVVRAAALEHHSDLVVIGHGRLHATLGRLRSNAYGIIRDSPCPVIRV